MPQSTAALPTCLSVIFDSLGIIDDTHIMQAEEVRGDSRCH